MLNNEKLILEGMPIPSEDILSLSNTADLSKEGGSDLKGVTIIPDYYAKGIDLASGNFVPLTKGGSNEVTHYLDRNTGRIYEGNSALPEALAQTYQSPQQISRIETYKALHGGLSPWEVMTLFGGPTKDRELGELRLALAILLEYQKQQEKDRLNNKVIDINDSPIEVNKDNPLYTEEQRELISRMSAKDPRDLFKQLSDDNHKRQLLDISRRLANNRIALDEAEKFYRPLGYAYLGAMSLPFLLEAAPAVATSLAPGTTGGTIAANMATGLLGGKVGDNIMLDLTGYTWGLNVSNSVSNTAKLFGLDTSKAPLFLRDLGNLGADFTNPGYSVGGWGPKAIIGAKGLTADAYGLGKSGVKYVTNNYLYPYRLSNAINKLINSTPVERLNDYLADIDFERMVNRPAYTIGKAYPELEGAMRDPNYVPGRPTWLTNLGDFGEVTPETKYIKVLKLDKSPVENYVTLIGANHPFNVRTSSDGTKMLSRSDHKSIYLNPQKAYWGPDKRRVTYVILPEHTPVNGEIADHFSSELLYPKTLGLPIEYTSEIRWNPITQSWEKSSFTSGSRPSIANSGSTADFNEVLFDLNMRKAINSQTAETIEKNFLKRMGTANSNWGYVEPTKGSREYNRQIIQKEIERLNLENPNITEEEIDEKFHSELGVGIKELLGAGGFVWRDNDGVIKAASYNNSGFPYPTMMTKTHEWNHTGFYYPDNNELYLDETMLIIKDPYNDTHTFLNENSGFKSPNFDGPLVDAETEAYMDAQETSSFSSELLSMLGKKTQNLTGRELKWLSDNRDVVFKKLGHRREYNTLFDRIIDFNKAADWINKHATAILPIGLGSTAVMSKTTSSKRHGGKLIRKPRH